VQRVVRFVNNLPHFKILNKHEKLECCKKEAFAEKVISTLINIIPFKNKVFNTISLKTHRHLGLDYSCIAFQKIAEDIRAWNWEANF